MSRDYIPTYRVEYKDNYTDAALDYWHPMVWDVKRGYGKPTADNLENWRVALNESFKRGGVNYHISERRGILIHITHARSLPDDTDAIVASVTMPMFEVV